MRKSDIRLSAQALKIHDQWLIDNGYKEQATRIKLTGPMYNGSNYRPMSEEKIELREERKRIKKFNELKKKLNNEAKAQAHTLECVRER